MDPSVSRYDLSLPMQKSPAHLLQQAIDPTDPIGAAWIHCSVVPSSNRASDWIPLDSRDLAWGSDAQGWRRHVTSWALVDLVDLVDLAVQARNARRDRLKNLKILKAKINHQQLPLNPK